MQRVKRGVNRKRRIEKIEWSRKRKREGRRRRRGKLKETWLSAHNQKKMQGGKRGGNRKRGIEKIEWSR